MTIHYHGTPISPRRVLHELAGRHFCVSFADDRDVEICHEIGQSVMLDNGAFSFWRSGKPCADWKPYFDWARPWLDCPTTWAIIPDVIDGTEEENDALIEICNKALGDGHNLSAVWHLHESLDRLNELIFHHEFFRVCIGSSGEYRDLNTPKWNDRMNEVFNDVCRGSGRVPCQLHMLRGMSLSGSIYPFASVDSTDIARNHNRKNNAREMADRWDLEQCAIRWTAQPVQSEIELPESAA
jgi:hypothetical protein